MKKSKITAETLISLVNYDPSTGIMTSKVRQGRFGCTQAGHHHTKIGGIKYPIARLIWLYMTGSWPTGVIDHIDQDKANNKWVNLRDTSVSLNTLNKTAPRRGNAAGVRGVHKLKTGKFRAKICVEGKDNFLGNFNTVGEASLVYEIAKQLLLSE